MKRFFRFAGLAVLLLLIILAAGLSYIKIALPDVGPAENIKIDYSPARIARGSYLAQNVTVCMDCHSHRDFTKFSGPIMPGTLGMGGELFDQSSGLPGIFYASNITPTGIARYTDGELVRVITTGVNKEGKAMFPLMPYQYYGRMDTDDIYSIVAYIRSIPPIVNDVPASIADFPVNFIMNTIPKKASPVDRPDTADVLTYGEYMINAAACRECHTPENKGQIIKGREFAGGREFRFPDGTRVTSSNITPDNATGIGNWTSAAFVQRFKAYADSTYRAQAVIRGDYNSPMPWTMYGRMKRSDLEAIFDYLRSVKAVSNKVVN